MNNETFLLLQELHNLLKDGIITQEEFAFKKEEILKEDELKNNPNLSNSINPNTHLLSVENNSAVKQNNFDFTQCIKKYKITVISVILALANLYVVYYFLIRNDPVKDAQKAATSYCNCVEKNIERLAKSDETFLNSFNNYSFTTKEQARDKWYEVAQNGYPQDCFTDADNMKVKLRNRYSGREVDKFDENYNLATQNFKATNYDRYMALETNIDNKINAIKNPTPDVERIKSDLIGKQTQLWKFNYLSDFNKATVTNTTENNGRLELTVLLKLNDSSQDEHDAEVVVVYMQDGENWIFNSVKMNYITYTNTAPVDYWQKVTPLYNANHSTDYLGNKIWIKLPCQNDQEIPQGPDVAFDGRRCTTFYIRSRESSPVKIKITYTPKY